MKKILINGDLNVKFYSEESLTLIDVADDKPNLIKNNYS